MADYYTHAPSAPNNRCQGRREVGMATWQGWQGQHIASWYEALKGEIWWWGWCIISGDASRIPAQICHSEKAQGCQQQGLLRQKYNQTRCVRGLSEKYVLLLPLCSTCLAFVLLWYVRDDVVHREHKSWHSDVLATSIRACTGPHILWERTTL